MKFKPDAEALVLGALTEGPLHGYGIIKALREGSIGLFSMNEGQLYPLLHKMQEQGWIKGEWETADLGPAKKTYILLEEGRLEFQRRKAEWSKFVSAVNSVMTFSPHLGSQELSHE